jgi:hypothetical protein
MLNQSPIFINGFQRGGTSILLDLLSSHPNVCSIGRETHQVFYGTYGKTTSRTSPPLVKWIKRFMYCPFWGPILLASRQNTFATICLNKRNKLPYSIARYVDFLFYWHKLNAPVNKYKLEGIEYSKAEIKNSRMLCKNLDGVVLATDLFDRMYPNATFIGLVRNGLAVCEGFVYRGFTAEYCGKMYLQVCEKMIEDSKRIKNYHIVKFEDLLLDYKKFINQVYDYANLDLNLVNKFKIHSKKSMSQKGIRVHKIGTVDYEELWLDIQELSNFFRPEINSSQINNLNQKDKDMFLKHASSVMQYFGYI